MELLGTFQMVFGNVGDGHASGFVGIELKLFHQQNINQGVVPETLIGRKLYRGNKMAEMILKSLYGGAEVGSVGIKLGENKDGWLVVLPGILPDGVCANLDA
jgi:hypothetical protein